MQVWVSFRHHSEHTEFLGVYSNEQRAMDVCETHAKFNHIVDQGLGAWRGLSDTFWTLAFGGNTQYHIEATEVDEW